MKTGISGFPSSGSNEIGSQNFVTVEPLKTKHFGVATHPYQWVEQITASVIVVAGSTTSQVVATGHGAIKGDVVRFLTGALTGVEVLVGSIIDADNFTVAELLSVAPSNTDTFQLLRFRHPRIDQLGAIASSALIQYTRNGASQTVTEDTVTPANNRPLPVKLENASGDVIGQKIMAGSLPVAIASDQSNLPVNYAQYGGVNTSLGQKAMAASAPIVIASDQSTIPISAASLPLPTGAATSANQATEITSLSSIDTKLTGVATAANQATGNTSLASIDGKLAALGQKAMAGSEPVVIASDQSAIPIKAAVNANGSGSAAAATVSTVITLTAPANAVGFILQCLDTSTANVRWCIGRVATTTLGQQLQPGRDTGFVPCGANVSLCAESGTQNYDIQWVSQ